MATENCLIAGWPKLDYDNMVKVARPAAPKMTRRHVCHPPRRYQLDQKYRHETNLGEKEIRAPG